VDPGRNDTGEHAEGPPAGHVNIDCRADCWGTGKLAELVIGSKVSVSQNQSKQFAKALLGPGGNGKRCLMALLEKSLLPHLKLANGNTNQDFLHLYKRNPKSTQMLIRLISC
jgi:hypothetical protein